MINWVYLTLAIVGEVIGTSALKASEGFTRFMPSALCVMAFAITFYFLSLTLRAIPVGVAYAVWSGVGIVLISIIGYFLFNQSLDVPAIVGIALIICGVVVINTMSDSVPH